jgi:O-antigen ligase
VSTVISLVVVLATLAFGAVYPWAYEPLFGAAACIGIAGFVRARGVPAETRHVSFALCVLAIAIGIQLAPLPTQLRALVSPKSAAILSRYVLTFSTPGLKHPLSINPSATMPALLGFAALGFYLVGLPALLSRRVLRSLPRNLLLFGVALALFGMYSRQHNNGLVYGFWQTQEHDYSNGFGPFVNRNHFAGWMLMTTCLGIGVLCGRIESAFERVQPGLRNRLVWLSTSNANRIALIAVAILIMAVSLVWTVSRSGIVSFVSAMACFVWLLAHRRHITRGLRIGVSFGLSAVLLASASWRGFGHLQSWFADTTDLESRRDAWRDAWSVVRDFWMTGTGINTYRDAMLFYQKHVLEVWMTHAHNDYLELLAEGGLLVTIPAMVSLLLLVAAIVRSLKASRDHSYEYWIRAGAAVGLIAIAIQETVEFSLRIPANSLLFVTLAAIALSPLRPQTNSPVSGVANGHAASPRRSASLTRSIIARTEEAEGLCDRSRSSDLRPGRMRPRMLGLDGQRPI